MKALTANDKAGNLNAVPLAGTGARGGRSTFGPSSLLVLIATGARIYGVAVVLKFPLPSVAVRIVAAPGAGVASGRQT